MALTPSTMLPLGTQAPDFALPDPTGKIVSLKDFPDAKAYLIIFMCNHCPYVKHVRSLLAELSRECQKQGVAMFGINANNVATHPQDSPEMMAREIQEAGYVFPYLYDESQAVAKAYKAACTPDPYLFDPNLKLVYRGQLDGSRPGIRQGMSPYHHTLHVLVGRCKKNGRSIEKKGIPARFSPGYEGFRTDQAVPGMQPSMFISRRNPLRRQPRFEDGDPARTRGIIRLENAFSFQ